MMLSAASARSGGGGCAEGEGVHCEEGWNEALALGNLCARAGKKLILNEAGSIVNDPEINELAWREPREGWAPLATIS